MEIFVIKKNLKSYQHKKKIFSVDEKLIVSNLFKDKYGIELSEQESNLYTTHIAIWIKFFKESTDQFCLIKEEGAKLLTSTKNLQYSLSKTSDKWDVFFPFDKINNNIDNIPIALSRLGFFWGAYTYFINRESVAKLLCIFSKKVLGPIDEVLLNSGISKEIKLIYADTNWFFFNQNKSQALQARKKTIFHYLNSYSVFQPEELLQVREVLKYLSTIGQEENIKIFLHAGTLLGYIRHRKIMDWDDDVDLMIDKNDLETLVRRIKSDNLYEYSKCLWKKTNQIYYKIWKKGGFKVRGYEYTFPFVDIWILHSSKKNNKGETNDGYKFSYDTYYPLRKVTFEEDLFYTPNKSFTILDKMYEGWREKIHIFSWSHKHKKHIIKQIIVPIKTNKFGKFINYK